MTVHNQADVQVRCALYCAVTFQSVQITVEPCLQSETTFDAQTKDTKLSTDLPPTSKIVVKWTEKQKDDVAVVEAAKQPLSLLVEHEHMFSIGEGMLLMDSLFHYDIRSGRPTCCVLAQCRQQRHHLRHRHHCGSARACAVGGGAESEALGRGQGGCRRQGPEEGTHSGGVCGYVTLRRSRRRCCALRSTTGWTARSSFRLAQRCGCAHVPCLRLMCQLELGGTSVDFYCPVFAHAHDAISREKGFIAVEARTTVELDQVCLPLVLPRVIWGRASRALAVC